MDGKGKTILVTGATGHQGGAVARRLIRGGWGVRALTRNVVSAAARNLQELGAEVVRGDLSDTATLAPALAGVYGVFAVLDWHEDGIEAEIKMGRNLVDAAKEAGVRHFVYSSVASAERNTEVPFFKSKGMTEDYIRKSGIPATVLRPAFFTYNFESDIMKPSILTGMLAMPLSPDRPLQILAVEDYAEFVAVAFGAPRKHIGKSLDIAGDELTMTEAAHTFSRVLGRPVEYVRVPLEQVRKINADYARMFEWMEKNDFGVDILALRKLHPAMLTLEGWLRATGWHQPATKAA